MTPATESDGKLVDWYESNIGQPETRDEAYGYLIFSIGLLGGLLGTLLFLQSGPRSLIREVAVIAAAGGLILLLIGPIVRLPLRRRATLLSYLGAVIAAAGIAAFSMRYPESLRPAANIVVLMYAVGMLIIGIGGVVVPVTTGTRSQTAKRTASRELAKLRQALDDTAADEDDLARGIQDLRSTLADTLADHDDLAAAVSGLQGALADTEADESDLASQLATIRQSQARFELYEDAGSEWRWRLRHRNGNVIADSGEGYTRVHNARKGIQSVQRNAFGAEIQGVPIEDPEAVAGESFEPVAESPSQASFEVYEDAEAGWRWRLTHDNGNIIADSGEGYHSERNARRSIDAIQEHVDTANYLQFDPVGFETYLDEGGQWRWRLVHRNGNILADSGQGYSTHSNARRAAHRIRDAVDEMEFEVYEDGAGEYRWRLSSGNNIVADSGEGYSDRSGAEDAVDRVEEYAPEADILEIGTAVFELYEDQAGEHRWRLRHRNGNILADSGEGYADRSGAIDGTDSVKRNAPTAEVQENSV